MSTELPASPPSATAGRPRPSPGKVPPTPVSGRGPRRRSDSIAPQRPSPHGQIPIPMQIAPGDATPVYGTAQPTGGPAEAMRRAAYRLPAHNPNRWLMLLAADRAEVSGNLARESITPGQQLNVLRHFARQARSYPRGFAVAGVLLGLLLVRSRLR